MTDGASEIRQLASDFSATSRKLVGPMRQVFKEIGDQVAKEWRANAEATSGEHGKWYPASIDAELTFSTNLSVEVGPNRNKRQGAMGRGFEFGSVNQPPHLDGLKAVDKMMPVVEIAAKSALDGLMP